MSGGIDNSWRKASRLFSTLGKISIVIFGVSFLFLFFNLRAYAPPGPPPDDPMFLALGAMAISMGTLLISAIGTLSTAILGWLKERREGAEAKLRMERLELELKKARSSLPQQWAEEPRPESKPKDSEVEKSDSTNQ